MAKKEEWLLVLVEEGLSRLNGNVFWRLTYMNIADKSIWEMTVDGSYRNFSRNGWDRVVSDPNPWGIYTGLKRTSRVARSGNGVLTADGHPEKRIQIESFEEIEKIVQGLHDDAEAARSRTRFGELFR